MSVIYCVVSPAAGAVHPLFPWNFYSTLPDKNDGYWLYIENTKGQRGYVTCTGPHLAIVELSVCLDPSVPDNHTLAILLLSLYDFLCSQYFWAFLPDLTPDSSLNKLYSNPVDVFMFK